MYYVGANASVSASAGWLVNCIGVATATQPGGPYTDQGPLTLKDATAGAKPIGCGDDTGESNIDPSPFLDPSTGNAYLYVSTERGEVAGGQYVRHSTVSVIPLDPGLLTASGPRVPLLTGDANTWEDGGPAEGPTVEGPFMELHNGTYYLFYSGGNWTLAYGMGYATGQGPAGPFTKSPANPIMAETPTVFSPGGGDRLVTGPHGGLWLVYHARANSRYEPRTLRIDPLSWKPAADAADPDVPAIAGPTSTPQSVQP
jgi:beta-xylosidase